MRTLALAYKRAGTSVLAIVSRCSHMVRVQNGLIQSDDWVVFFRGKKYI